MSYTAHDIDIMARTVYGEARGEYNQIDGGIAALMAVASVIKNRVKQGKYFGKNLYDVCLKKFQFSCWNKNDINFNIIQNVTSQDKIFTLCLRVCEHILKESWPDLTGGCDHYHSTTIAQPSWAMRRSPRIKIARHIFYAIEGV